MTGKHRCILVRSAAARLRCVRAAESHEGGTLMWPRVQLRRSGRKRPNPHPAQSTPGSIHTRRLTRTSIGSVVTSSSVSALTPHSHSIFVSILRLLPVQLLQIHGLSHLHCHLFLHMPHCCSSTHTDSCLFSTDRHHHHIKRN